MLVSCPQNCNITLMLTNSDAQDKKYTVQFSVLMKFKISYWKGSCLSKWIILADSDDINGS